MAVRFLFILLSFSRHKSLAQLLMMYDTWPLLYFAFTSVLALSVNQLVMNR